MFGHIARMDDNADAKVIITAPPPENWKRPPGRPRITWLNTIQQVLRAYSLTLNEAVDLAQNLPLWRLMSTYGSALRTPNGACQKRRSKSKTYYVHAHMGAANVAHTVRMVVTPSHTHTHTHRCNVSFSL